MATLPVPAGPPNCYGPNVKENARTPGSFVISVSTWCRRGAPATNRIMPDRSKCATPSAPTSTPRPSPTGLPPSGPVAARLDRVALHDIARQAQPTPSIQNTEPITMDDVIIIG